jgi:DNA mismatch repair protein MSH5
VIFTCFTKTDREIEIIQSLLEEVLTFGQEMENACDVCAELDCLLAFAAASNKFDYKRPTMVETNSMKIMGGRSVSDLYSI